MPPTCNPAAPTSNAPSSPAPCNGTRKTASSDTATRPSSSRTDRDHHGRLDLRHPYRTERFSNGTEESAGSHRRGRKPRRASAQLADRLVHLSGRPRGLPELDQGAEGLA